MNKHQLIEKCVEKTREYLKSSIPENFKDFEIKDKGESFLSVTSKDEENNTNESEFQIEFYI